MYLNLSGCSSLKNLPSSIGNATKIEELNLSFCSSLVELPSTIGNLTNLQKLDLSHCSSLVKLPSSMKNLRRLSILDLKKCSKLEVLTDINLESLEELSLSGTPIKEIPSSLRLLPPKLEISYGEKQELGPLIGSRLHRLVLSGMPELILLPQLPDSLLQLDVENCKSLEKLDCLFHNPDIRLNFAKCFKLNQEARDLIIETPTSEYTVLPGEDVPVCFTYRSYGSSLTVKLDQKPLDTSTRFSACILLADKDKYDLGHWGQAYVSWTITSKKNDLSSCISSGKRLEFVFPQHMYTFEVEAMATTSTEVVFEFKLHSLHFDEIWEIKQCGILHSRKLRSHRETKMKASSSSPMSPESSLLHKWKHHVFPSFHRADVSISSLSHFLEEFRTRGIDPFIDNDIERSKSIGPELIEAIRGSRMAIVLLSKNYASSTWCLDELVQIIKCREELGQTVMVLFYEVDPTDVEKQTGDFGKVFTKTCKGKTKDDTERWKHALAEVAKIAGYHSKMWDNEAQMIENFAIDVSKRLIVSAPPSMDLHGLIGIESHMRNMGSLLRLYLEEVRIIGILGPPGIGKTTIARTLYSLHSQNFELCVFMIIEKRRYPVSAHSDDNVKLYLKRQFMSQLPEEEGFKIPHLGIVKERLKDKKVLVVLDDVDHLIQLEALAQDTSWFGDGSRIIITTQDEEILRESGVKHIYRVGLPSSDEALQIFCVNAFGQSSSKDGFQELAWQVTRLAGGLPLGLRVMGSYFRRMSKQEWTKTLTRLRISLNSDIQTILKFSYDALDDEDKDLFLHVACFFNGEFVSRLEDYLAHSFLDVTRSIHALLEKSLISQSFGMIKMNNLLVQMGSQIVRNQSIFEPRKRQFLVDARDIDEVLRDDTADGRSVRGIDLKFSYKDKEDVTCISERAFERLPNVKFLRINGDGNHLYFPRSLNSISRKLRFLSWMQFPMSCLPSSFHPEFLVKLEMPTSKLEKLWEGIRPLHNLKWMDLSFSESLKELPDLSTASNLCEVDLSNCASLVELPFSIGNAINLQTLNLSHCLSLVKLPSSMSNLCKLSKLDLKACSKLEVCLTNINLESLKELDLSDCLSLKCYHETSTSIEDLKPSGTQELTPWIGRISHLHRLVLNGMQKLVSLPQLPYSISELDAVNCKSLERLDCSFRNPEIRLNFAKCFKLNQEARDLIIQTRTNEYIVLPGGEVPVWFTYRASGNSITVKLNPISLRRATSTIFRACIILADKDEYVSEVGSEAYVYCSITSKQAAFSAACRSKSKSLKPVFVEHLYTFEVEAVNLTSTEVVFEFQLLAQNWEIKNCGIVQLMEVPGTRRGRKKELNDGDQKRMRVVMK